MALSIFPFASINSIAFLRHPCVYKRFHCSQFCSKFLNKQCVVLAVLRELFARRPFKVLAISMDTRSARFVLLRMSTVARNSSRLFNLSRLTSTSASALLINRRQKRGASYAVLKMTSSSCSCCCCCYCCRCR